MTSGNLYNAACAYAIAAHHAPEADYRRQCAEQALQLLRAAVDQGWQNAAHLQTDVDMDGIRGEPVFQDILSDQSVQRAAVWMDRDAPDARAYCESLSPEDLTRTVQRSSVASFVPRSLSVAWNPWSHRYLVGSVWQEFPDDDRENLAALRQEVLRLRASNALSVLSELQRGNELWDLIRDERVNVTWLEQSLEPASRIQQRIRLKHRNTLAAGERDADALSGDVREIIRLEALKQDRLDWSATTGSARKWWLAFEQENSHRIPLVLRLVEELDKRTATITEFFLAYVYSNTDNIQGNLHYLDFTRRKKAYAAAAAEPEGPIPSDPCPFQWWTPTVSRLRHR